MQDETPRAWRAAFEWAGRNIYGSDWEPTPYDKHLLDEYYKHDTSPAELSSEPSSILPGMITYTSTDGRSWADDETKRALSKEKFRKWAREEVAKWFRSNGFRRSAESFPTEEFLRKFEQSHPGLPRPAGAVDAKRVLPSGSNRGPKLGTSSPKGEWCRIAEDLLNRGEVKSSRGATAEIARIIVDAYGYGSYQPPSVEDEIRGVVNEWRGKHRAA